MAAESWQVAFAVGVQSAFGTINSTISGLSGALDSTDGIVLGDRESGDGESGITLPQYVREQRERADVGGSFTASASSFERVDVSGLSIAFELKGNGGTGSTTPGEAQPLEGIDALLQMSGLAGANGTASTSEYDYTPNASSIYGTIKLWDNDLAYVFKDCIIETLTLPTTGGEVSIAEASIRVGSLVSVGTTAFPTTLDYGTQASLSAPTLVSAGFAYGMSRDFQSAQVGVSNGIVEIPSGNSTSGIRLTQDVRRFDVDILTEVDSTNSDFDDLEISKTTAPTNDATWRLGSIAGTGTINGVAIAVNNIQQQTNKGERAGEIRAQRVTGYATGTTAGSEFTLTFD